MNKVENDLPLPQPPEPKPANPVRPAQHVAPAAHSEAAAHGAQEAASEVAIQQATANEEVGREAIAQLGSGDPLTPPPLVAAAMPEAPRRRPRRRPRGGKGK